MPALKNQRHEAFCHYVVEGRYQSEAYKLAGFQCADDVLRKNASRLMTRADVKARVLELSAEINEERVKAAVQLRITPAVIIQDLMRLQRKSEQRGAMDSAIRATTEIARVAGLYRQQEGHQGAVHVTVNTRTPTKREQQEIQERRRLRAERAAAKLA